MKNWVDGLQKLEKQGLRRRLRLVEGAQGTRIKLQGREVLNFCSNNYLGLADDPRLREAAIRCMEQEGFGSGAARLVCGNLSAHQKLEEKIAQFKQVEGCLVFNSGYTANLGILPALFSREDIIFADRLNHASIIDGILLSQAQYKRYPHKDMDVLEEMLRQADSFKKRGIVTDTVFSMDGDIAPLESIVRLAVKYDCLVMVDEAHAIGVLGKNGSGAAEHFGLQDKIQIQMGTLSKAVGSFGAYCCGRAELIEYLINNARSFIYTTALPPAVAAASLKGIEIIQSEPERRQQLWSNTRFLLGRLKEFGFNTLDSETPIVPIVIGAAEVTVRFSERLLDGGIFVVPIRPPTVPENTSRLRVSVMATHTQADLEYFVEQVVRIGKELEII